MSLGKSRYVMASAAALLVLVCSSDAFGVKGKIYCSDNDIQKYNKYKERLEDTSNEYYLYKLYRFGLMSFCMGRPVNAMSYWQQAFDLGHIASAFILGISYETDHTFDSLHAPPGTRENLDAAIYYYEEAAKRVNNIPDYPDGASENMDNLENEWYISYYIFTRLPWLYFHGYDTALQDVVDNEEKVDYTDSLDVLDAMLDSARNCLERPALPIWQSDKQEVYSHQQTVCDAFFDFAGQALPLEEERMTIARDCAAPLSECPEHRDIYGRIDRLKGEMFSRLGPLPEAVNPASQ